MYKLEYTIEVIQFGLHKLWYSSNTTLIMYKIVILFKYNLILLITSLVKYSNY